jgi:hypothetical protein
VYKQRKQETMPKPNTNPSPAGTEQRREEPPSSTKEQQCKALGRFLVQAVAGTLTALERLKIAGHFPCNLPDENWQNMVKVQFINYLNMCWESLLIGDDDYVTEIVEQIGHKSPVCLFHFMARIGQAMIPSENLVVTTTGESYIDAYRDMAFAHLQSKFYDLTDGWCGALNHHCTGETLEELRAHGEPIGPLFYIGAQQQAEQESPQEAEEAIEEESSPNNARNSAGLATE